MSENLSRNNHYLSQMYLEAWKNENNKVEVYELLVPNIKVPLWQSKSIRSVGSLDNIFVRLKNGKETDDIEKWFNEKYETPVKIALDHAINDERITIDEWHSLIDFLACHIVRSPAFIIKTLDSGKKCDNVFQEALAKISQMKKEDFLKRKIPLESAQNNNKNNDDMFPFKMTNLGDCDKDNVLFKVETIIGKQFYLWHVKNLLENTSKILHKHKWSIITVDERVTLPTSDDPVICLNYYKENNYDFGGGWGKENGNIIFPISPQKVLFTQIGIKLKPRINADYQMSLLLKKMIVEHSHRKVISKFKDDDVTKIKPRYINEIEFKREKKMWEDFQKNYLEKEIDYIK